MRKGTVIENCIVQQGSARAPRRTHTLTSQSNDTIFHIGYNLHHFTLLRYENTTEHAPNAWRHSLVGIVEVIGLNPIEEMNFSGFLISNCLNWKS